MSATDSHRAKARFPDLDGFFYGAAWQDKGGIVRVMATADNYVMWRYKGCSPGVLHYKDFLDRFTRTPGFDK